MVQVDKRSHLVLLKQNQRNHYPYTSELQKACKTDYLVNRHNMMGPVSKLYISNNTWIYVHIKKLDKFSTPIPSPESFNSNSNSNSGSFNSNSNSGKSLEYQLRLQLQLREFQLQLQQVSWISTPTPTPELELSSTQLQLQLRSWPQPWLGARLQYLHCISSGDTAVLHWAIDPLWTVYPQVASLWWMNMP